MFFFRLTSLKNKGFTQISFGIQLYLSGVSSSHFAFLGRNFLYLLCIFMVITQCAVHITVNSVFINLDWFIKITL